MNYYVAMASDHHDVLVIEVPAKDPLDACASVRAAYGGYCHCVVFDSPPVDQHVWSRSELEDYYD